MAEQDFIDQIQDAERQAEALIKSALEQSRIDLVKARQEAADMISAARHEAEAIHNKSLADAQDQVERIESENKNETKSNADDPAIDKAADAVAERIVKYCVNR